MRKRDKKKEKKEILTAFAMITQIGLAMMICMALSFGIGFYIDRLFATDFWVIIFLVIGILASIRSLFVLTGRFTTAGCRSDGNRTERGINAEYDGKRGKPDEGSEDDTL